MSKRHDKGPWKAVFPDGSNGYWDVLSKDGESVGTCYGDRAEANARFIVKAANALMRADAEGRA
jgi:hypothetical protein